MEIFNRMLGAARLSVATFEDVENDKSALWQALVVVVAVAIASGVGALLSGDGDLTTALAFGVVRGIVSWVVWAFVAWIVGAYILKTAETNADWGQLARGTGFAQTPGLLSVLVAVPGAGGIIGVAAFFWQLAAMVVAVRQCLDYTSTLRAFFVILISAIPVGIINAIIYTVAGI